MNYYEHHLGDYLRDTAHLSMLEDGAYRRLLDAYYIKEAPLPAPLRDVFRLVRAQSKQDREAVETVLREFFDETPEGWKHNRCEREVARFQDKQRKAKASAEARWGKPQAQSDGNATADANASADAMRTHSEGNAPRARPQTPVTSHQSPDEKTSNLSVAPARPSADQPAPAPVGNPKKGPPDCPHLEVLALWAEVLPAMPQHLPSQWKGTRADHLRARWREVATEKGWTDKAQGLAYLRKFFGYVGQSPFLTGRKPPGPGRSKSFTVELEWLVNPTNWARVHEGKYHEETA